MRTFIIGLGYIYIYIFPGVNYFLNVYLHNEFMVQNCLLGSSADLLPLPDE